MPELRLHRGADREHAGGKTVRDIELGSCPKCTAPLVLGEETDIIDELAKLADLSSAKVELISDDFEEGSILF